MEGNAKMTDEQLLEYAANASGLYYRLNQKLWNPLLNNNHAFELQVLLKMKVHIGTESEGKYSKGLYALAEVEIFDKGLFEHHVELITNDAMKALRRAITTAAAKLWKAMQND